ncbi:ABC transporter substrate-binding protein, partial [Klebsiella pneumoniae]
GRFGASYIGLIALLQANGMEETDIQLETIGFVAPDVICAGGVEAAVVYLNNEPLQVQHRADAGECGDVTGITVIPLTESVDLVSNGIATNETMIAEQPETVAAVIAAFDQGVRDTINNPALTYLLSIDYIEGLPASEEF